MNCPSCGTSDYYFGMLGPNCVNQSCINFKGSTVKSKSTYSFPAKFLRWTDFFDRQVNGGTEDLYIAKMKKDRYFYVWEGKSTFSVEIRGEHASLLKHPDLINKINPILGPSHDPRYCVWDSIITDEETIQKVFELAQDNC